MSGKKNGQATKEPNIHLVGKPRSQLSKLEADLSQRPWQQARDGVRVKLLPREGELYVLARSDDRRKKERAMRRRKMRKFLASKALLEQPVVRDDKKQVKDVLAGATVTAFARYKVGG